MTQYEIGFNGIILVGMLPVAGREQGSHLEDTPINQGL